MYKCMYVQILTLYGTKYPLAKGIKVCPIEWPRRCPRGYHFERAKMHVRNFRNFRTLVSFLHISWHKASLEREYEIFLLLQKTYLTYLKSQISFCYHFLKIITQHRRCIVEFPNKFFDWLLFIHTFIYNVLLWTTCLFIW